jgi:hypothetical protein
MSQKFMKFPPVIRFDHTGPGAPIASCFVLSLQKGPSGEVMDVLRHKRRYYSPAPAVDDTVWKDRPKRIRNYHDPERSWKAHRAAQCRALSNGGNYGA